MPKVKKLPVVFRVIGILGMLALGLFRIFEIESTRTNTILGVVWITLASISLYSLIKDASNKET